MKIRCTTRFDITATGVTGHYKPSRIPFTDNTGKTIATEQDWNHARNQQRNWETITQLISLRTQVDDVTVPVHVEGLWTFEFSVESETIFVSGADPIGILKQDCNGVPMLLGGNNNTLTTDNIWFELINIS